MTFLECQVKVKGQIPVAVKIDKAIEIDEPVFYDRKSGNENAARRADGQQV